jgi:hypothetical protein
MLPRRLLLVLPDHIRGYFAPLVEAWNENNISIEIQTYQDKSIPGLIAVADMARGFDAVLLAGDARFAPRTVLSGPFVSSGGNKIPISWLPFRNAGSLSKFIQTATDLQLRKRSKVAIGLLSQRLPRYLQVADKMEEELTWQSGIVEIFRWTSELVIPEDMLSGINCGLGAAIYLGHGRPVGWSGYYGVRICHFADFAQKPLGSVLSLCCHTANRRNTGISFSENLVTEGIASSAFGATMATLYTDNTRWAVNICHSLNKGIATIGELLADAAPMSRSGVEAYRLIGDPLAPLYSDFGSIDSARKIKIYR